MKYMIIRVNAVWLVHKLPPKNLLLLTLQFRINRTLITCTRQNDEELQGVFHRNMPTVCYSLRNDVARFLSLPSLQLITGYKCLAAGRESNGTEKVSFKWLVFLFFDYPRPRRLFHNQQSKRGTDCRGWMKQREYYLNDPSTDLQQLHRPQHLTILEYLYSHQPLYTFHLVKMRCNTCPSQRIDLMNDGIPYPYTHPNINQTA